MAAVDDTLGMLKSVPVAAGADGVSYPGERSAAVAGERAEKGVPVAPKVWLEMREQAERLGGPVPVPVRQFT
ncbi:hypothetical protein AB0D38_46730 [Streptomyces sp. NPDC048279]|uniref:hypothetical protein n=1 Tax=Streptomyces sp. NPDC048279 TaxID=3154714 RepID=UPI00342C4347